LTPTPSLPARRPAARLSPARHASRARATVVAVAALTFTAGGAVVTPSIPAAATERIAVAGGAITEVLYAIGAQARIVAVDATSLHPPEALKTKRNLGYFRALSTEGVLSTAPTAIIASDKAGPPEVVKALKSAAIAYHEVDDRPTPEALVARIRTVAALVGKATEGEALATDVTARFDALAAARGRLTGQPRKVLFVFSIQNGRMVVGGGGTGADAMIRLAGGVNAAVGVDGYKPIGEEAVVALAPDVILFTGGGPAGPVRAQVEASATLMTTPAGRARAFVEMDGLYLLGFGPRAPDAARDLMVALYGPDAVATR
jgi:iron complex transport system substrate-binding protein